MPRRRRAGEGGLDVYEQAGERMPLGAGDRVEQLAEAVVEASRPVGGLFPIARSAMLGAVRGRTAIRVGVRIPKVVLLALIAACAAVFLPGAAATTKPVYRVVFSFTSVGKSRPPNIVETRRVGQGALDFDESPKVGDVADASSARGKVVVEYDFITPEPNTARLTLAVTGGTLDISRFVFPVVILEVAVIASNRDSCPAGREARSMARKARSWLV